ncbi:MAG: galactonate dehydratase [Chloroflexi bacterium]|nr:MAG: galactonate dehydratase [Chloroflexota bacterium]
MIGAKILDMPWYKLLGGPVRDKVICYPHTQRDIMSELLENCRRHINVGRKFVRWHQSEIGPSAIYVDNLNTFEPVESIRIAEQQIATKREVIVPETPICFDIHTRLDTAHAVVFCEAVGPYAIFRRKSFEVRKFV